MFSDPVFSEKSSTPVLMLTARHDDIDRILGLELGADDYLAKPFNPRELVARIRAILRRVDDTRGAREVTELTLGQVNLSVAGRELKIAERTVEVTLSEFNILRTLLLNKGEVISKDKLSLEALGRSLDVYDRSIDVHVSHLRKKLKGSNVQIRTVRAVGYCIETQ
ncbi:MAG: response regulator transcription factor [Candidatus Thiodiazotropha sp.]